MNNLLDQLEGFVDAIKEDSHERLAAVLLWNSIVDLKNQQDSTEKCKKEISDNILLQGRQKQAIRPRYLAKIKRWSSVFIKNLPNGFDEEVNEDDIFFNIHEKIYNFLCKKVILIEWKMS